MYITVEWLTELVVRAVLHELASRGICVHTTVAQTKSSEAEVGSVDQHQVCREVDFIGYKTPVLTEDRLRTVEPETTHIIVPDGTYCTLGAKELMRKRAITLKLKNPL